MIKSCPEKILNPLFVKLIETATFCQVHENIEVVYVTNGNPAFGLGLYLIAVHFRGELQHVSHVGEQNIKCPPIITRELAGVRL